MKVIIISRAYERTYHVKKVEVIGGELHMTTNNSYIILESGSWDEMKVTEEGDDNGD